ncbi:microtubule-associated protein RP/EB family member 1b-like, partial [Trifolium medium]|nr:microtubule-associated protein RP/EB family member 1b-like [Trifolium medium]
VSVAIKKILYANDAKESALDEAQDYLNQIMNAVEAQETMNVVEAEAEAESEIEVDSQN